MMEDMGEDGDIKAGPQRVLRRLRGALRHRVQDQGHTRDHKEVTKRSQWSSIAIEHPVCMKEEAMRQQQKKHIEG